MKKLIKVLMIVLVMISTFIAVFTITSTSKSIVTVQAAEKSNEVKYKLEDGVLTVYGNGKMPSRMRFINNKKIKEVIIKKGVTEICENAFSGCTNLKKVKIANSVKKIGYRGFYKTKIKKVKIPKSVKEIGIECFSETKISQVKIPKTVKRIGVAAFSECKRLKKVTMPGNFKIITYKEREYIANLFESSAVKKIKFNSDFDIDTAEYLAGKKWIVKESDPNYKSINGVIYNKDGSELVRVPYGVKNLTVADGCKTICLRAIIYGNHYYSDEDDGYYKYTSQLKNITIPKSVTDIEYEKYYATSDVINEYVEEFYDIPIAKVKVESENISDEDWELLIEYILKCIEDNSTNSTVYIKALKDVVEHNDESLVINDDFVILNGNRLFKYVGDKAEVTIPDGIEEICDNAFYNHTELTKVVMPNTVTKLGQKVFSTCGLTDVVLSDNITIISEEAFSMCTELVNVNTPKNIREIGKKAFCCTKVNPQAFLDCESLEIIRERAFSTCGWKVIVPAHVKVIESKAIPANKTGTTKIIIQGTTEGYAEDAFISSSWLWTLDRKIVLVFECDISNWFTMLEYSNYVWISDDLRRLDNRVSEVVGVDGYEMQTSWYSDFHEIYKVYDRAADETEITEKFYFVENYIRIRPYKIEDGIKQYGRWTMVD